LAIRDPPSPKVKRSKICWGGDQADPREALASSLKRGKRRRWPGEKPKKKHRRKGRVGSGESNGAKSASKGLNGYGGFERRGKTKSKKQLKSITYPMAV